MCMDFPRSHHVEATAQPVIGQRTISEIGQAVVGKIRPKVSFPETALFKQIRVNIMYLWVFGKSK